MRKVSFDFDHTLSNLEMQHFAYNLINLGIEVWVCTARCSNEDKLYDNWGNEDLYTVTDKLKIPRNRIIFCNYEEKRPFLEAEGFEWHLDDDYLVINSLRDSFVPGIHCLKNGWLEKCIKILNIYEMNNKDYDERLRIVQGLHKDFVQVETNFVQVDTQDVVELDVIVKEIPTGKFFSTKMFTDTANPDRDLRECNVPEFPLFKEVFPKIVTTTIYV